MRCARIVSLTSHQCAQEQLVFPSGTATAQVSLPVRIFRNLFLKYSFPRLSAFSMRYLLRVLSGGPGSTERFPRGMKRKKLRRTLSLKKKLTARGGWR